MNNDKQNNFLESLFEQARLNQPDIEDAGFSGAVMSALPSTQPLQLLQTATQKKSFSLYDVVGLGVGAVACFTIIEPSHLVALANNLLPDELVLSPLTLLTGSLAMAALAFTGWQLFEGDLTG